MKKYEVNAEYIFTKQFTRGFVTIPEGTICTLVKIEDEMMTFNFEGHGELTFPTSYIDDFVVRSIKFDEIDTLIKPEIRFELPSEEELEKCRREVGDGAPPSLIISAYSPDLDRRMRFYLHAFRSYCFQISGSITGVCDCGSSPICDLPAIAGMDHGRGVILALVTYAINEWANRNARLVNIGGWRFNPQSFAAGFGSEYEASEKWFEATLEYLRGRNMGGSKK